MPSSSLDRRTFLKGATAAAVAPAILSCEPEEGPRPETPLFTLGIASGDPDHESVVLWTRLAPDPLNGGGMPDRPVMVLWEVARSRGMRDVVAAGMTMALPENGHAVHAVATGLEPDRWYWYRFRALGETSPLGQTRTFPHPQSDPRRLRFALASCQHYQDGFFPAYRDMIAQDLDFVMHVGDYIYENGPTGNPIAPGRVHASPEVVSLVEYRNRYAQYKLDPDLQAAHRELPFIVTWDDHEVDNNYAGLAAPEGSPYQGAAFAARRRAAYQAYAEAMPLRPKNRFLRGDGEMRIHRRLSFGRLADLHVLDTRQFRTDQPTRDGLGSTDPDITPSDAALLERAFGEPIFDRAALLDPASTMLGFEQEAWLAANLENSQAHWNVLAQQVMVMPWNLLAVAQLQLALTIPLPAAEKAAASAALAKVKDILNVDGWDGAQAARGRLLQMLSNLRPNNPVVLTGDVHSAWASNLFADFDDPASDIVAAEFVCTGIASAFRDRDPRSLDPIVRFILGDNPHIEFFNSLYRGYCVCDVTDDLWRTEYRGVGSLADLTSPDPAALIPMPGKAVETDAVLSIVSGFNAPGSADRIVTESARVPTR